MQRGAESDYVRIQLSSYALYTVNLYNLVYVIKYGQ